MYFVCAPKGGAQLLEINRLVAPVGRSSFGISIFHVFRVCPQGRRPTIGNQPFGGPSGPIKFRHFDFPCISCVPPREAPNYWKSTVWWPQWADQVSAFRFSMYFVCAPKGGAQLLEINRLVAPVGR